MARTIVLNTIAYQEVLKNNPQQGKLISEIKSLGIQTVEIRREYLTLGKKKSKKLQSFAKNKT